MPRVATDVAKGQAKVPAEAGAEAVAEVVAEVAKVAIIAINRIIKIKAEVILLCLIAYLA